MSKLLPSSPSRLAAAALLAAVGAAVGCGASKPDPGAPLPTVAHTQEAAKAHRRIEMRWAATPPARRVALLPELEAFVRRFAGDPTARRVRLYVAWLYVERGELDRAESLVERHPPAGPGVDADLSSIVKAAISLRRGRAEEALQMLEPLRGKVVDADDRMLYGAELVRATLEAERYDDAFTYMLDFAEFATPLQQQDVKVTISDQVRRVPMAALEEAQEQLAAPVDVPAREGPRAAARKWLQKTIREQLVRWALTREDVALAGRLLDRMPASLRLDDTREALMRLAARGSVDPRVEGRALGLVLELGSDRTRRRSAEVAAAMSRELGSPRGAGAGARLVSREAASAEATERALAGLAGDGAAILVAGMDAESAEVARAFAAERHIPVMLLTAPQEPVAPRGFAFVLGDEPERVTAAIEAALAPWGSDTRVVVGDRGAVACDLPMPAAGALRFPVREWKRAETKAVVLGGDARCADEVARELARVDYLPTVVLGLEAGGIPEPVFRRVLLVSAGPFRGGGKAASHGWYAALGADAARLGSAALADFPLEQTREDGQVAELHARARDALARVETPLTSTEASGFSNGRRLPRTFSVVDAEVSR